MITLVKETPKQTTVLEIDKEGKKYSGEITYKSGLKRYTGSKLTDVDYFVRERMNTGFIRKEDNSE